jgi:hypothetical protein
MPETLWYIRSRGRVSGPFTALQLESMRERGQFSRFHEVTTDRHHWVSAARVPELFPPSEARQPVPVFESYSVGGPDFSAGEARGQPLLALPASDDAGSSWFYARGGTHHGPVAYEDLRRMAAQGEIGAETLLWKSGMADWVACRSFPDLVSLSQAPHMNVALGQIAHSNGRLSGKGIAIGSLVLAIIGLGLLAFLFFHSMLSSAIERMQNR